MFRWIHFSAVGLVLSCVLVLLRDAGATIVLFGSETVSYPTMDSSFTPAIPESGILGSVYAADPLNGCSTFPFEITERVAFAVVQRGDCSFEQKVRNSQQAGFTATIVYDNAESGLVTMSGNGAGITTHALFVSKEAGESLLSLKGSAYILPGYKRTTWAIKWLILSVSLIVIVIVGALVTALCCIRAHILAMAEKEALEENFIEDDDYLLSRDFVPENNGVDGTFHDVSSDTDGEHSNLLVSECPSESDQTSEKNLIAPK